MRFRLIHQTQIDDKRTTLFLSRKREIVVGRISTQALDSAGALRLMTTDGFDPPIAHALAIAQAIARLRGQDLDVCDPECLWPTDLGRLE